MKTQAQGFTLVETLVGMALSLSLLAMAMSAWAAMQQSLQVSADKAALVERVVQSLGVISTSAQSARAASMGSVTLPEPCQSPATYTVSSLPRLMLAQRGAVPCFPSQHMPAGAPLLMIDSLSTCDPDCPRPEAPGFLYLDPGCHPVLERTSPEIRLVSRQERPADCGVANRVSLLTRQLFYFRDDAWAPGDNLGAIMVKQLRAENPVRWGRAEMLLAGVTHWSISPVQSIGNQAAGVTVSLGARSWVEGVDASALVLERTVAGATALIP